MAHKKKKGFSLDKGNNTDNSGFNISKGDKTTSSFGLDKSKNKAKPIKKTASAKKSSVNKKSSSVADTKLAATTKGNLKQVSTSSDKKSSKSKIYVLVGVAAVLAIVFMVFSGGDDSSDPSPLSIEVNSGDSVSPIEEVSTVDEIGNSNEPSAVSYNDSSGGKVAYNNSSDSFSNNNASDDSNDGQVSTIVDDSNVSGKTNISEKTESVALSTDSVVEEDDDILTSNDISFSSNDVLYYFSFGSSYINPNDKLLNKLANELINNNVKVRLIGHTDNRGSEMLNLQMSKARASSVYDFLVSKGVNKNLLSVDGLGESKPLNNNSNSRERALNRRVELIFN